MKKPHLLFLSLTLFFLLFGFIAHNIPASQTCCCFDEAKGISEEILKEIYDAEPCLVCQLQTVVQAKISSSLLIGENSSFRNDPFLHRIDHSIQISRPPTFN